MANASNAGIVALGVLTIVFLVVWTFFSYGVLIAAFVALDGLLKVLMGLYIVGSIFTFVITLVVKSRV